MKKTVIYIAVAVFFVIFIIDSFYVGYDHGKEDGAKFVRDSFSLVFNIKMNHLNDSLAKVFKKDTIRISKGGSLFKDLKIKGIENEKKYAKKYNLKSWTKDDVFYVLVKEGQLFFWECVPENFNE